MIFSHSAIETLRLSIKDMMSQGRYQHTLGVEKMANYIGGILLPQKSSELSVAALLHDITKEMSYEEQLLLLQSSDLTCSEEDLQTKPALHSFSAVPFIKDNYEEYATQDILSAVLNHTLGAYGMSLFDEIIFISDYSEEGRKHPACIEVREYLIENLCNNKTFEENVSILHKASIMAINSTIHSILQRGDKVNSKTFLTKNFFDDIISK